MAGYQGDYSTDYQWWDNVETVTGSIKLAGGSTQAFTANYAFRGDIARSDQDHGIVIHGNEQIWCVPSAEVGNYELKEEDTLTDSASVVWVVRRAVLIYLGSSKLYWQVTTEKRRA